MAAAIASPREDAMPGSAAPPVPMERLESTLLQFEALCLNGGGKRFRGRLRAGRVRLHTMLAGPDKGLA